MAIFKPAQSKNWWVSVYMGKDKPRRYIPTGSTDEAIARAVESTVLAAMRGNMTRDRLILAIDAVMGWSDSSTGTPVSGLWALYLQTKPRAGKDTIDRRRRIAEQFTKWMDNTYPSTKYLHEVTPQSAQAFCDWIEAERGGNGKTKNNRIGNLKTIFGTIVVRAGLQNNPFEFVQRADQSDSQHGRAFTPDEEKALLTECKKAGNNWLEISLLARYTGLRLIDIANLRWDCVFNDRIELIPSKTARHEIRVKIPLHEKLKPVLARLEHTGDFLFPDMQHHYATTKKSTGYTDLIEKAKIQPGGAVLSFHCWRHTFRTRLAAAAVPQEIAMKLGGWTNESTAEIYNHDFTQMTAAINALD